jgi:DNA-directed RNA polymerase subunit M/transcription elongation factor TFIIS
MTDEEIKRRLLAEAEKAIDRVIADRPTAQSMRLRDVEGLAVRVGTDMSASTQKVLSEEASQRYREQGQACPQCGAQMRRRGEHVRQITTEAGSSPLERTYYECAECGHHFFPAGRGVGTG